MGVVVGIWHCIIIVMPWHSGKTDFLSKKAFRPYKVQYTRIIIRFGFLFVHFYPFGMKWEVLMTMTVKITAYRVWCRVLRCSSEKRPSSIFKGGGTLFRNIGIDLPNYPTSHPRKLIFSSLIKRSVGAEEKVMCPCILVALTVWSLDGFYELYNANHAIWVHHIL